LDKVKHRYSSKFRVRFFYGMKLQIYIGTLFIRVCSISADSKCLSIILQGKCTANRVWFLNLPGFRFWDIWWVREIKLNIKSKLSKRTFISNKLQGDPLAVLKWQEVVYPKFEKKDKSDILNKLLLIYLLWPKIL